MRQDSLPSAPVHEVLLIVAIFAGWFIYVCLHAVATGFPVPSLSSDRALGLVLFEVLAFLVAAGVLYRSGWRARDFSFRITWLGTFVGVLLFGATLLVHMGLWDLLGSRVAGGEFVAEFARNVSLTLPVALLVSLVNGAYEEFFLTRYLLTAFAASGAAVAIGVSALVRLLCHLYQGPFGALSVVVFGIVLSAFYWRYREIWPVMFAHMLADFVALA